MVYSRKRGRRKSASRTDGEQYANFGFPLINSPAWRSLSGAALKLLMELRTRYHGTNNGKLALSLDHAATLLGLGKATVQRAFVELQAKGFVIQMERGQWYGRKPTTWALTIVSLNGNPATHDWKRWTPPKKQSLGSEMDPSTFLTGPVQNRSSANGSATEPVTGHFARSIGSEMDP
jgi:hypothetical protein